MNALATMMSPTDQTIVKVACVESPLGPLHVATLPGGVCTVAFDDRRDALELRLRRTFGPFFSIEPGDPLDVSARLRDYFDGDLAALRGVALATAATPMQRRVWALVGQLEAGSTTTYATLADRLGMPRAQRAVGVCLASNPVPLFVPCHRVVTASGGLGSHPGGVIRKRWLLRHEAALGDLERARGRARQPGSRGRGETLDPGDVVHLVRLRFDN